MTTAAIDAETTRALVADAQRGDRAAAERLVRDHEHWIRSVVYGVTGRPDWVDDITQQVWAQVWERLASLDDPQRLRPWLYRVARNAAIDAGQARRRQRDREVELADGVAEAARDIGPSPPAAVVAGETRTTLLQAVQALPAPYREPFVLRHLEDWSYARIADVLGLTAEAVETRLVRARRLLRDMLAGKV